MSESEITLVQAIGEEFERNGIKTIRGWFGRNEDTIRVEIGLTTYLDVWMTSEETLRTEYHDSTGIRRPETTDYNIFDPETDPVGVITKQLIAHHRIPKNDDQERA